MVEAIRQGDIPGVQLRRRRLLPGTPPSEAWTWLVEPAKLQMWLCERAKVDLGPSGGLELGSGGLSEETLESGATLELEPPRRWILSFRAEEWSVSTRLTLQLSPSGGGTEVMVLQQGFQALPLSDGLTIWEASRRRWEAALDRLAAVAETS
ncbi:MAG: SRPBCC domain-containing protein [Acidobacteriota bacterium]|nr:SRPBCC domain-containing protein [Acidobacteriota bacterium]